MTKIFYETSTTDDVITFLTELAKQGKFVFCGYSKQDELLPSLIREETEYYIL